MWRAIILSWKTSPILLRVLWAVVVPIHLLESMTDAYQGMSAGLNLCQLDMILTGVLLFYTTCLLVYGGVRRGTLAKRTSPVALTTGSAESLLAEFAQFRSPLIAVWAHRWTHVVALALVAGTYFMFSVRSFNPCPLWVLTAIMLALAFLNGYLIMLAALGHTWGNILKDLRRASNKSSR